MRVTCRVIGFLFPAALGAGCGGSGPAAPDHKGAPASLVIIRQPPANPTDGQAFLPGPIVGLLDKDGVTAEQAAVAITATIDEGAGVLGGDVTEGTLANGQAVFSNLVITGLVGPRRLRFTAHFGGETASVVSQPIGLVPGLAGRLSITVQPSSSAVSGVPLARQPAVQVLDAGGNVLGAGTVVRVAPDVGGCLLAAPDAITDQSGVATFQGLTLSSGSVHGIQLTFSTTRLGGISGSPPILTVASDTIAITVLGRLMMSIEPSASVQLGIPFPQQPAVQFGNEAGDLLHWPGLVTATVASGPSPRLFGAGSEVTAASDGNGVARFTGLNLTSVGPRTIQFTSNCFQPVTSAVVTVQP